MEKAPSIHQDAICRAMRRAGFYPHPAKIRHIETHISHIFLTGEMAYKMKKPVNLGFLDFTDLRAREHFCRQELVLNRRLTTDLYLGVEAVTYQSGGYALNGPGEPVEYLVKMRQLSEEHMMARMLEENRIDDRFIVALAEVLATFHREAERGAEIDRHGHVNVIRRHCEDNFRQTEQFLGEVLEPNRFQLVRSATRAFLNNRASLFGDRVEEGMIRDGHGDLRTEHIHLSNGIQIIDGIEYNPVFRYQDVVADLAALAVDLDFKGYRQVSETLLAAYMHQTGDRDLYALIDFYKMYRAMIKIKVRCSHLEADQFTKPKLLEKVERYLALAYQYALKIIRPTVWVVCGTVATGKSTIADAVARALNIEQVVRTDDARKRLFGPEPSETARGEVPSENYTRTATALAYGKSLLLAQDEVDKGRSVILDGPFGHPDQRREVMRFARNGDANLIFIVCQCPEDLIVQRLHARANGSLRGQAPPEMVKMIRSRFAPTEEVPGHMKIHVDTRRPVGQCLESILSESHALISRQIREMI